MFLLFVFYHRENESDTFIAHLMFKFDFVPHKDSSAATKRGKSLHISH